MLDERKENMKVINDDKERKEKTQMNMRALIEFFTSMICLLGEYPKTRQ